MTVHSINEQAAGRRGKRRRSRTALAVGLGLTLGVTGLPTTTASATGEGTTRGGGRVADPPEVTPACPEAYPVSELTDGQQVRGMTVERGTKPGELTATVLGVIDDGIAPDVDMVIVDTESAALTRAGGVWAGMSGSPVYAEDGRLIGAIAYGLAGASNIAGVTPAEDMYSLLERPFATQAASQSAPSAPSQPIPPAPPGDPAAGASEPPAESVHRVDLPAGIERRVVASGGATAAEASSGLRQLPIPLGVSGVGQSRLRTSGQQLENTFPGTRVYAAGSTGAGATAEPAPADGIFPGSNFAATIAHGDVTMGAVGTTTVVCNVGGDKVALAFGHPFQLLGPTSMSAHVASSVLVQPDVFGPFKVANFGGVVGTVDQDRQAGLRSRAGRAPASAVIDSTVTSADDNAMRSGSTEVNLQRFLPEATQFHLIGNLDRVFDRIGGGASQLRWVIRGTRSSGERFEVDVSNRYADTYDVAYGSSYDLYNQIAALDTNAFDDVRITSVNLSGTVSSTYTKYSVASVDVRQPDGTLVPTPVDNTGSTPSPIRVTAGTRLSLRVGLRTYRSTGPLRYVDLSMNVPAHLAGTTGSVNVVGGPGWYFGPLYDTAGSSMPVPPNEAHSFEDVLAQLEGLVPNDSLSATLQVYGNIGGPDVPPPHPIPMAGSRPAPGAVNRTGPQSVETTTTTSAPPETTTTAVSVTDPMPPATTIPHDNWINWDQTVRKQTGRVTDGNKWFNVEVVAPPK
jgi:hypothetical protein